MAYNLLRYEDWHLKLVYARASECLNDRISEVENFLDLEMLRLPLQLPLIYQSLEILLYPVPPSVVVHTNTRSQYSMGSSV